MRTESGRQDHPRLELILDTAESKYLDPASGIASAPLRRDPNGAWAQLHADAWCQPSTLRVEAWVRTDRPGTEGLACTVSAWSTRNIFDGFSAHDAAGTSGLDVGGFLGASFDGRYVYFVPQHNGTRRSGNVLRYDTHQPFTSAGAYSAYDASRTAGMDTRGYYGAVFDGRYIYFTPRMTEQDFHSRVLRYDTRGAFTDALSWDAHDAGIRGSFQGAAFDGRYIYFCPGYVNHADPTPMGIVLRLDTQGEFHDAGSWMTHDISQAGDQRARNFDGGAYDGRYVYFMPLSEGAVLRYDTTSRFTDDASWDIHNVAPLGIKRCVGSTFDGRFLYLVPYGETRVVVRYDTRQAFSDQANWIAYDAGDTDGLKTVGYDGAFFDGRFVYFIPFWNEAELFHGNMLRYDTRKEFTASTAWSAVDAGHIDGIPTRGYNAGAFDGRYFYCAPWHDGSRYLTDKAIVGHARILRYDTTGRDAAFSLRYSDYGHNGGLSAAAPGPGFVINTDRGPRGVWAHQRLEAGEHCLVGEYDGRQLHLLVNGRRVASRAIDGIPITSSRGVTIGRLSPDAGGQLPGIVTRLRIGPC